MLVFNKLMVMLTVDAEGDTLAIKTSHCHHATSHRAAEGELYHIVHIALGCEEGNFWRKIS